jgi:hypothetical protein
MNFLIVAPGEVLVEFVDASVTDQTSSTRLTLSLHTEKALGQGPQCVEFQTRCTGIAEDEVTVPLGGTVRRLAASTTVTPGPYAAMVGNQGSRVTMHGNLKAWFRP